MILAICMLHVNGERDTNPTLFRVCDFELALKQCTYSAQHLGTKYPAYVKSDRGRLLVRMATYRGV